MWMHQREAIMGCETRRRTPAGSRGQTIQSSKDARGKESGNTYTLLYICVYVYIYMYIYIYSHT